MIRIVLALSFVTALGCASPRPKPPPQKWKTFHYKVVASELQFGKPWHTTIDVGSDTRWADAVHLKMPRPGVVRVKTQMARLVPVNLLVYSGGKKPLLVQPAPGQFETPRVDGDVWVVVRGGETTGQIVVKLIAELVPEPGDPPSWSAAPPPPPRPAPGAADTPALSDIPDLEFPENAPE